MTMVKICGLTRLDDALAATEAGADLLGFVMVTTSPRYVPPQAAGEMVAALRARGVRLPTVGVVAGLALPRLQALRRDCGFDLLQLHGGEPPELAAALHPGVIVARQVRGQECIAALAAYRADAYLLDGRGAARREGTPATWDWRLLQGATLPGRVIVAGGLSPENVARAVRLSRPWGVDVASGVEHNPRRKDRVALARFVRAVRQEDARSR